MIDCPPDFISSVFCNVKKMFYKKKIHNKVKVIYVLGSDLFVSIFPLFDSFRINAVSNGQVRGDSYSEGCMGQTGMYCTHVFFFFFNGPLLRCFF